MLKFNTPTSLILASLLAIYTSGLAIISPSLACNQVYVGDVSPSAELTDDLAASSQWLEAEKFENFYQRCTVMLGDDCGDEIFYLIIRNDTLVLTEKDVELVSNKCCGRLVNMGRHCHDKLVNVIAQTTDFSTNSSATLPWSSQVWQLCSLRSS